MTPSIKTLRRIFGDNAVRAVPALFYAVRPGFISIPLIRS